MKSDDEIEIEIDDRRGSFVELGPAQRRGRGVWWLVPMGAAVVALLAFTSRSDQSAAPTPTTAPSTTVPRSSTTAPDSASATTVGLAPTTTASVQVIGPLVIEPTGVQMVVAANDGLTRVDVDTGTLTQLATDVSGAYSVEVGGNVALVQGNNGLKLVDLTTGVSSSPQSIGASLPSDDPGALWTVVYGEQVEVGPVGPDGKPLAPPTVMPSNSQPMAVLGGKVVAFSQFGGTYVFDDQGPRRLSTGQMVAWGGGAIVVTECDDRLQCADVMVEISTGERTPSNTGAAATPQAGYYYGAFGSLSADHRRLARFSLGGSSLVEVLDTASGSVIESFPMDGSFNGIPTLRWSRDGTWLAWVSGGRVQLWREGLSTPYSLDLPTVQSFALLG